MVKPIVLITSATSRNGSQAAKLLLAQGKCTVRLAARNPTKLADLVADGAEAIAVDVLSSESMIQACTGVDSAYVVLPSLVQGAEHTLFHDFLQAAKATGIKHVVYMSSLDAEPSSGFKTFHSNYEHEQMLLKSGIPTTVLRAAWFHENTVAFLADSIKRSGEFQSSAGDGVWTSIAVCDIAAAAVTTLNNPQLHSGKIYSLTTEAVTEKVVAEKISKVVGKKVTHVNLTPEEHANMLKRFFPGPASGADEFAHAIVQLDEEKRSGLFREVHPDLEQLLGRKGVSLDDFLAQHAQAFQSQEAA